LLPEENSHLTADGEPSVEDRELIEGSAQFLAEEDHRRKISSIQRQIAWRRGKVAEYDAKGFTQQNIADELKVSIATVNSDLVWLRQKAAESIKTYTQDRLPSLFEASIKGLTQILREAWLTSGVTKYERNKILSLQLAKECIAARMDLASNADVIDKTALFVTRKRKALEALEADEEEYEELPTPVDSERPEMIGDEEHEITPQQQEPTT
jgi:hypothetical protein